MCAERQFKMASSWIDSRVHCKQIMVLKNTTRVVIFPRDNKFGDYPGIIPKNGDNLRIILTYKN